MVRQQLPALANYLTIDKYTPEYGDLIIWAGWFATWYGLVADYEPAKDELTVIFGGLPRLLVTMDGSQQVRNSRVLKLAQMKAAASGTFAVVQHNRQNNLNVFYV